MTQVYQFSSRLQWRKTNEIPDWFWEFRHTALHRMVPLIFKQLMWLQLNPPSIIIWFSPKDIPALVTLIEAKACNFSCRFSKVSGFLDPLVSFSFLQNANDFLLFFKADHFFLTTLRDALLTSIFSESSVHHMIHLRTPLPIGQSGKSKFPC